MPRASKKPPPGGRPSGADKSQDFIDAVNRLAASIEALSEAAPSFVEAMEVVSQQFAVIIAAEAQRRNTTAENLIQDALTGLGEKVFGGRRRR